MNVKEGSKGKTMKGNEYGKWPEYKIWIRLNRKEIETSIDLWEIENSVYEM